jgi:hypothetical protein
LRSVSNYLPFFVGTAFRESGDLFFVKNQEFMTAQRTAIASETRKWFGFKFLSAFEAYEANPDEARRTCHNSDQLAEGLVLAKKVREKNNFIA